jgi:hypothetical protein
MEQTYFVYREPESIEELKSLLLLRYSVYMESRFQRYKEKYKSMGIELDCYDVRARHFGLFKHENGTSRPVGYIRMVLDEEGPWSEEIRAIAEEVSGLAEIVNETPSVPFPLMTYFPDAEIVNQHYLMAKRSGRRTVEAGRLSLGKTVRSISIARNMVSATVSFVLVNSIHDVLVTCVPSHSAFYYPFGFETCAGTEDHFCEETRTSLRCLHGHRENVSHRLKPSVLRMAEAYYNTSRICFSPSNPEQFYAPTQCYIPSRPRLRAAV